MVLCVSKEESVDVSWKIAIMYTSLRYLQLLTGVNSDDWSIHIIIINSETNNKVVDAYMPGGFEINPDDWR